MEDDEITVAFVNVGQGDSTVVTLPDAVTALVIDCPMKRRQAVIEYLLQKGITTIHVFITHSDADHFGGTIALLENFVDVQTVAYNHDRFQVGPGLRRTHRLLRKLWTQRGFTTLSPHTDDHWTWQGVDVEVLHPSDENLKFSYSEDDTNNASIVLRVTFAQRRILLTADVQKQGWQWILERATDLRADVLKFPHHGAWFDDAERRPPLEDILQQVDPSLVVLSVGTRNPYKHPHPETFSLLRKRAELRFVCTEATPHCHPPLATLRNGSVPCAGTVEIAIGKGTLRVKPTITDHDNMIRKLDKPQCKVRGRAE